MTGSKPRILEYMRTHPGITNRDALLDLGTARLSARIQELRDVGYNIVTVMVDGVNKYGEPVRYGLYKLVEDKDGN